MLPQASRSSFPDIMAMMIFKSPIGPGKAGNLGFAVLGRRGLRDGHSLRDSSDPGDWVYTVSVLVGAGFKPAQARAI